MKKIVSIGLLVLFTFNVGGYYFLFWVLKQQADEQLSLRLDANLNDVGSTFEIKIPLALPYPFQQSDFERKDGEFVYKNEHFHFVKQKLQNDTLTIVCVKNQKAGHLAQVMDEFTGRTSGDQSTGLMLSGKMLQEYEPLCTMAVVGVSGWTQVCTNFIYNHVIHSVSLDFPSPPPRT